MEGLMHYCKNWGKERCHIDVAEHAFPKELKEGEEIPIWPVGEKQDKLDNICRECEFWDLQPK